MFMPYKYECFGLDMTGFCVARSVIFICCKVDVKI